MAETGLHYDPHFVSEADRAEIVRWLAAITPIWENRFGVRVPDFETRRVNLTFRYVPDEHVLPFARLPCSAREDVRGYLAELARGSAFFAAELAAEARPGGA